MGVGTLRGADSQHPRRCIGDSGASLVEFALIAPLLFAILLGTITGGLALSKKNSMTNAVREGGRLGATLPEGTSWDNDWAIDVRDRVIALAGNDLANADVCVQMIDPAAPEPPVGKYLGADCSAITPPATPSSAEGCIVKVWARTEASLDTVFFSRVLTLDGSAVGLYERESCP